MKAAVFLGPGKMEVKQVDTPTAGLGEVRLKIEANAVCGTDVRIFTYGQKNVVPPAIIGHEICGVVDQVGEGVEGVSEGARVTLVTCVGCGHCEHCAKGYYNLCPDFKALGYDFPGAYAEYMIIPEPAVAQGNVIEVPENLSPEEVALIEPLSCCINGQEYLNVSEGDVVAIFGCGPIGLMHSELVRAQGASRVLMVDAAPDRLEAVRKLKAGEPIAAENSREEIMRRTGGAGVDVAICACGVPQVQAEAIEIAKKKGRVSFFAGLPKDRGKVTLDTNKIHYWEVSVFGAFASHKAQYVKALELAAAGKVDLKKFVTHKFGLDDISEALEVAKEKKGIKVVVTP